MTRKVGPRKLNLALAPGVVLVNSDIEPPLLAPCLARVQELTCGVAIVAAMGIFVFGYGPHWGFEIFVKVF